MAYPLTGTNVNTSIEAEFVMSTTVSCPKALPALTLSNAVVWFVVEGK